LSGDLDERILQSITKALERIGGGVSTVSFYQFKAETGLDKSAIPRNMDLFKTALSMFFGVGYKFVVLNIREELKKDFHLNSASPDDLAEIVELIRKNELRRSLIS